jgi:hypothetical protein
MPDILAGAERRAVRGWSALSRLCGLTFELSGHHRQGAWAARRMIGLSASRPKGLAGGGPLERPVRHAAAAGGNRGNYGKEHTATLGVRRSLVRSRGRRRGGERGGAVCLAHDGPAHLRRRANATCGHDSRKMDLRGWRPGTDQHLHSPRSGADRRWDRPSGRQPRRSGTGVYAGRELAGPSLLSRSRGVTAGPNV